MELNLSGITETIARMATMDRPIAPNAEPVRLPSYWRDHGDVQRFYERHKNVLTWDQVDALTETYDRLKAAPKAPELPPEAKTEDLLTQGWRDCCKATQSQDERARRMAGVVAEILGKRDTPQIRRVYEMYTRYGMKETHRAVIQLCGERLDVESRFKFLEHRIKTAVEFAI